MRKKRIIILSSIFAFLALVVILASTVFTLKTISVNFSSTGMTVLSSEDASGIVKAGKFETGKNIFFMSFSKQTSRIEKSFPYAKVVSIERKFPNKAIVHIVERQPVFYVFSENKHFVFDEDLKLLKVSLDFDSMTTAEKAAPELKGFNISENLTSGDFEKNSNLRKQTIAILDGLFAFESHEISELSKIELKTTLSSDGITQIAQFEISFDETNLKLVINGENNLKEKIRKATAAYFQTIESNVGANGAIVVSESGESVTYNSSYFD